MRAPGEFGQISVTLNKAKRVLRESGVRAALKAAYGQLTGAAIAYWSLGRKREFRSAEELVDFGSSLGGGIVRAFQLRGEIIGLLDEISRLKPRALLELGTANGGTLFLLAQVAHSQAKIISVDLPYGVWGEGYALWRVPIYRRFAKKEQTIHLFRGNSHAPEMLERVRKVLGNQPLDALFIDGDHSYEGVKMDFETYGPLVGEGGIIAFHDIVHSEVARFQAHRFWTEIKQKYRHIELVNEPNQKNYGIGVLYV
jgi:predicted O-methyltransferase YrrM